MGPFSPKGTKHRGAKSQKRFFGTKNTSQRGNKKKLALSLETNQTLTALWLKKVKTTKGGEKTPGF